MTAGRFLLARLLLAVLSLWGVSVLVFVILRVVPGDPALLMAPAGATADDLERIRRDFGLAGPWWAQYGAFLGQLARGRFGRSLWLQQDALRVILERLPATLELALAALAIALVAGLGLGVLSVWRRRSWLEAGAVGLGTLGIAVPNFVWGLLLIVIFAALFPVLPISGRLAPELQGADRTGSALIDAALGGELAALASVLVHLVLPASALALPLLAAVFRTVRSDLLTALREDYVTTERMKGLGEAPILFWRVLKNALIPTTTLVGVQFGFVIGGTVLIETIFAWPGIGQLTLQAFQYRDFPLIQGIVMVYAVLVIASNVAVDLVYGALDPRVRPSA